MTDRMIRRFRWMLLLPLVAAGMIVTSCDKEDEQSRAARGLVGEWEEVPNESLRERGVEEYEDKAIIFYPNGEASISVIDSIFHISSRYEFEDDWVYGEDGGLCGHIVVYHGFFYPFYNPDRYFCTLKGTSMTLLPVMEDIRAFMDPTMHFIKVNK